MGTLCKKTIADLQTLEQTNGLREAVQIAGELVSKYYMENYETAGLFPEVDVEEVLQEEVEEIENELIRIYQGNALDEHPSEVLNALGDCSNKAVVPFLRSALTSLVSKLQSNAACIFQVIRALEATDEISPEPGGLGILDFEKLHRLAIEYLSRNRDSQIG